MTKLHSGSHIIFSSLKSASSRILREKYKPEIDKYYWGKAKLWHDSKCIVSCGGAPLEAVKKYIHASISHHPHRTGGWGIPQVLLNLRGQIL